MLQNSSHAQSNASPAQSAECFHAHAAQFRQMARQCVDKEVAHLIERLAEECLRAARNAKGTPTSH